MQMAIIRQKANIRVDHDIHLFYIWHCSVIFFFFFFFFFFIFFFFFFLGRCYIYTPVSAIIPIMIPSYILFSLLDDRIRRF